MCVNGGFCYAALWVQHGNEYGITYTIEPVKSHFITNIPAIIEYPIASNRCFDTFDQHMHSRLLSLRHMRTHTHTHAHCTAMYALQIRAIEQTKCVIYTMLMLTTIQYTISKLCSTAVCIHIYMQL